MPIRFRCEHCDARMKVPDGSQGRRVKCPKCGEVQKVPAEVAHGAVARTASPPAAPAAPRQEPNTPAADEERAVHPAADAPAGGDTPVEARDAADGLRLTPPEAPEPPDAPDAAETPPSEGERQEAPESTEERLTLVSDTPEPAAPPAAAVDSADSAPPEAEELEHADDEPDSTPSPAEQETAVGVPAIATQTPDAADSDEDHAPVATVSQGERSEEDDDAPGEGDAAARDPEDSERAEDPEESPGEDASLALFHVDREPSSFARELAAAPPALAPAPEDEKPAEAVTPRPVVRVAKAPPAIPLGRSPAGVEDENDGAEAASPAEAAPLRLAPRHPDAPTFQEPPRPTLPPPPSPLKSVGWLLRGAAAASVVATLALAVQMFLGGLSLVAIVGVVVLGLTIAGTAWGVGELALDTLNHRR